MGLLIYLCAERKEWVVPWTFWRVRRGVGKGQARNRQGGREAGSQGERKEQCRVENRSCMCSRHGLMSLLWCMGKAFIHRSGSKWREGGVEGVGNASPYRRQRSNLKHPRLRPHEV